MLISMIMMSLAALSAAETNWEFSRSFTIQAGRDTVASLEITPISAQTENYRIGMPFNIEDTQVQNSVNGVPNLGSGRTIANWSLISNTNFDLTIQAEPLHYTGDQAEVGTEVPSLNYILTFFCNLTRANGNQEAIEFSFDLNGSRCSTNHGVASTVTDGVSIFPAESASATSTQFYFDLLRGENIGLYHALLSVEIFHDQVFRDFSGKGTGRQRQNQNEAQRQMSQTFHKTGTPLQVLFDDAGDDSNSHALLLVQPRHGKTHIIRFPRGAEVIAGVSDGVDAIVQADEDNAVANIGDAAGIAALGHTLFEVIVAGGGGNTAGVYLERDMLQVLALNP